MGKPFKFKNRDIRFECENYDFRSGHCKAYRMMYDPGAMYVDGDGHVRKDTSRIVPGEPVGCSGDPKCEKFKPKQR